MSKKPDDAAKIAGLASILKVGNRQKEMPPPPSPALPPEESAGGWDTPPALPAARRAPKARVGKYRDPNFHHYGIYLRKETHKRANRRLEDTETGKDLSDLLQELLEQWLAS